MLMRSLRASRKVNNSIITSIVPCANRAVQEAGLDHPLGNDQSRMLGLFRPVIPLTLESGVSGTGLITTGWFSLKREAPKSDPARI